MDSLQDSAVRDLAWVIGSPGMLDAHHSPYQGRVVDDDWCHVQLQRCISWLKELDDAPLPLHNYIAAHPTRRLGHYFETLLAFWLTHQPAIKIIATNLQVQHEQRTQGEYDFLFKDSNDETCHWEAAVKFYLQQEPLARQDAFIGPGTRDRLDLKLDKVFQQQLQLGHTTAGKQALPPGITITKTQAFIKGYLFYHASTLRSDEKVAGISPAHLSGWWARHNIEKIPQASANSRWIILPRLQWLSPARVIDETLLMDADALLAHLNLHFSQHQDAVLIFEMTPLPSGTHKEIARGFIVSDTWPNIKPKILTI